MSEALWAVVGAMLGAIGATWLGNWLGRPKPTLVVDTLEVTTRYLQKEANVLPAQDLVSSCDDFPLAFGRLDTTRAVTEETYVSFLSGAQASLRDMLSLEAPQMQAVVVEFRGLVAAGDSHHALALFARHQASLWRALEGANLRDPIRFRESGDSGSRVVHEIVEDSYGDISLVLDGPRNLGFIWTERKGPQREHSKQLAVRCASAFASEAKEDLLDIADYLRRYLEETVKEGTLLAGRIADALSPYGRLVVTGIVMNRGGAAFSVLNNAKVVVRMKGYPRSTKGGDGLGFLDDDVDIGLRIGLGEDTLNEPIVVEGGKAARFFAVTPAVLSASTFGPELAQAFASSDRRTYLVASAMLPGNSAPTPVYSGEYLFRDTAAHPALPRR